MKILIQLLTLTLVLLGTPSLAQNGTILFNSNEPCRITVDGKAVGVIAEANGILEVSIEAGKYLVIATHRNDPSTIFRAVAEVTAGTKEIVLVELADLAPTGRFRDQGNGTVEDTKTGLIWMKSQDCITRKQWEGVMEKARKLKSGSCGLLTGRSLAPGE